MPIDPDTGQEVTEWQYTSDGNRYPASWSQERIAQYRAQMDAATQKYQETSTDGMSDAEKDAYAKSLGLGGVNVRHRTRAPLEFLGDLGVPGFGPPPGQIGQGDVHRPGAPDTSAADQGTARAQRYAGSLIGTGMARLQQPSQTIQAPTAQAATIQQHELDAQRRRETQSRNLAGANIERLTDAAEGRVPSAAEIQQQQGLQSALKGQLAAAASARGGAGAQIAAQRQAANVGAGMQAQATQQAAALRAQEQAQARGELTGAIQAQRAGDMGFFGQEAGVAGQQAGFRQQANMLAPQLTLDAARVNQQQQQLDNQLTTSLLGLGLDAERLATMSTADKQRLALQYDQMMVNRDLGIAQTNAGAQAAQAGAQANMMGAGLGLAGTIFGGPAGGAVGNAVGQQVGGGFGSGGNLSFEEMRAQYGGRA